MRPIKRTESILIPSITGTKDFVVPEAITIADSAIASSGGDLPFRRPQRENSMSLAKGLLEEADSAGLSPIRRAGQKNEEASATNFRFSKADFSSEKKRGKKLEQLKKLVNLSTIMKQDQQKIDSKNQPRKKQEVVAKSPFKLDDLLLNSRTAWYQSKPHYKGTTELDISYSKTIGEIRWRATSHRMSKLAERQERAVRKTVERNRCCDRDRKSNSVPVSTESRNSFVRSKGFLPQSQESSSLKKPASTKKKIEISLQDMENKYVPLLDSIGLKGIMRVGLDHHRSESP